MRGMQQFQMAKVDAHRSSASLEEVLPTRDATVHAIFQVTGQNNCKHDRFQAVLVLMQLTSTHSPAHEQEYRRRIRPDNSTNLVNSEPWK